MLETIQTKIIYDIEVYPNYFCFVCKKLNENVWYRFQLNENYSVFEMQKLHNFLKKNAVWIAFNQLHYDNVVLNFMLKEYRNYNSTLSFLEATKQFSDLVISDFTPYEKLKPYKYNNECYQPLSIDLFMYWSKGLRISKKISLKSLGVGLKHEKLQELPYEPNTYLTLEEQKEVFTYCDNDVLVTEKLYNNLYDTSNTKTGSIKLRDDVYQQTGLNCYSFDTPKIASESLMKAYCDSTGIDKNEVKNYRFEKFKNLKVGSLFSDMNISFETPKLKEVWNKIQNSIDTVSEEFVFICNETRIKISMGVGGIHSVNKNERYFTDSNYDLYSSDVSSLYPTNIIGAKTIRFLEVLKSYIQTKKERLIAKKEGNKSVDKFKKLILNSTSGLLDSAYSWLYYPEGALKLRLLGQLQLLTLLEKSSLAGFRVLSQNTDGQEVMIPKGRFEEYLAIVKEVEDMFQIEFEHEKYKSIHYLSVNDYIAVLENGKTKKKGSFTTEPELGDSVDFLVIPKALEAYFTKNIQPEDFIKNHINSSKDAIYDYCMSPKVDKSYVVVYKNKKQQRLNRFYPSSNLKESGYIYKTRDNSQHHLLKDSGVELFNNYHEGPYNINFNYFINKVKEVIRVLEPNQTELF